MLTSLGKSLIVPVAFTFWMLAGFSSSTKESGIAFFDGSMQQAMAESKTSGKPIFVYVYASWCGTCKQLKKTFKDEAVGEYYNSKFVPLAIDGEKGNGPALIKRYAITSYPTLLILDSNGKQLTRTKGFMKPYILISFGRRIVPL